MTKTNHHRRIAILNVTIDDVIEDEAITRIAGFIAEGGPHFVATINPEFVMEAQTNPAFRHTLAAADLATPDGMGLLIAARWYGTPLRGRVTGIELVNRIAAAAATHGWSLFLLGAAPGIAERAAAVLKHTHPKLRIVGCHAGSPALSDSVHSCALISAAHPDILLVAYGHPKQELWIAAHQPQLCVPVAIGVGGTFDFIAGIVPRAPRWMRRIGVEWLYRLFRQPWRWRRILVAVPRFLWAILRDTSRHQQSMVQ